MGARYSRRNSSGYTEHYDSLAELKRAEAADQAKQSNEDVINTVQSYAVVGGFILGLLVFALLTDLLPDGIGKVWKVAVTIGGAIATSVMLARVCARHAVMIYNCVTGVIALGVTAVFIGVVGAFIYWLL